MAEWFLTPAERAALDKAKTEAPKGKPTKPPAKRYPGQVMEELREKREAKKPSRILLFQLKKMVQDEEEGYVKYSKIRAYAADEGFSDLEDLINKIMLDENQHREELKRFLKPYL